MKVGPADIPAEGDALAAARRALGPSGVGAPGAGPAIEGFGVRFGTLLATHLAPPKPVSGATRGMAGRSVIDAALAARPDDAAMAGDGRPAPGIGAPDAHRPVGASAATGDALDPDGGRPDDPRRRRDPSGPATPEAAAPVEETFVPGLDAVRGVDSRAAAPAVPVMADGGPPVVLVPGEVVEDAGDAPRQAVPTGRYARMQAAIMAEAIRPAVDDARAARRDEPRALSDLTLTFGTGVAKGDLRVSRKGDDIVIGFAGGGEAMVIRGGAVHGGPTLVFADGRKVPGDALLYEYVDALDARSPDNGMPAGGLLA